MSRKMIDSMELQTLGLVFKSIEILGQNTLGTEQQKYGFIIGEDHKNVKKMSDPPLTQSKKMLTPPFES